MFLRAMERVLDVRPYLADMEMVVLVNFPRVSLDESLRGVLDTNIIHSQAEDIDPIFASGHTIPAPFEYHVH